MKEFKMMYTGNNIKGFNKTPGQLGEAYYNSVHEQKPFEKQNKVEEYYKNHVKDPTKLVQELKRNDRLKKKLGG